MSTKKMQELKDVNKVLMEALKLCIDRNKNDYIDAGPYLLVVDSDPYWLVKARAAYATGLNRGDK